MNTLALSQHTALIVGCGDVGLRIARQLQNAGATVTGIVRRDAAAIQLQGVTLPLIGDVPVQAIQALPYVLTVVLLAGFFGRARAPAALGRPYLKQR